MGEWRLPGPERRAARCARAAEQQIRRERDNQDRAETRAAAAQAEYNRDKNWGGNVW
jgi:hypothetical protein